MFTWVKRLKRRLRTAKQIARDEAKIVVQVDTFFDKLVEVYPLQRNHHGRLNFNVGHYSFDGGWLSNSFYFDVLDTDIKYNTKIIGRIYIGPELFKPNPRWVVVKPDGNYPVSGGYGQSVTEITKEDLITAINYLVPSLVKEKPNEDG